METIRNFHYDDWPKAVGLVFVHTMGILGVVYFTLNFSWPILVSGIVYFFLCHLSITVGAHRYFTHEAFVAKPWFAISLAILFAAVQQGPLYWWVIKHLEHHGNEDKPGKDPHSPQDGFLHSYFLWVLSAEAKNLPECYRLSLKRPGVRNQVILWQKKHHTWLFLVMGYGVPAGIGFAFGDVLAGLLLIGFTRLVLHYHLTWSINSIGHKFGQRIDATARNFGWFLTPVIGLLTVGESHHANHHVSPKNWRLGRTFWQWDPGAWVLRMANRFGWVKLPLREPSNRRRLKTA